MIGLISCDDFSNYKFSAYLAVGFYDCACWFVPLLFTDSIFKFYKNEVQLFFDFSLNVKAAPHECVIRTGQP